MRSAAAMARETGREMRCASTSDLVALHLVERTEVTAESRRGCRASARRCIDGDGARRGLPSSRMLMRTSTRSGLSGEKISRLRGLFLRDERAVEPYDVA